MPTGATTSLDAEAVKAAVRGILAGVTGIGKVADRLGALATWRERRLPRQAFCEVTVGSAREELEAADEIEERATVQIDVWMPWSHDEKTEPAFSALVRAIKDALRANRFLGQSRGVLVDDTELPQSPIFGEIIPFNDGGAQQPGGEQLDVHHAVVTFEAVWEFHYAWSETQ